MALFRSINASSSTSDSDERDEEQYAQVDKTDDILLYLKIMYKSLNDTKNFADKITTTVSKVINIIHERNTSGREDPLPDDLHGRIIRGIGQSKEEVIPLMWHACRIKKDIELFMQRIYQCEKCKLSADYKKIILHKKLCSHTKLFKCKKCPKKFDYCYLLRLHKKLNHNKPPMKCTLCNFQTNRKITMKDHKFIRHKLR